MSIKIGDYDFEGPFYLTSSLRHASGVYAILGRDSANDRWNIVDIGESRDVKSRVENHDRKDCWEEQNYSTLGYAAYYCPAHFRIILEKALRRELNPPCGER